MGILLGQGLQFPAFLSLAVIKSERGAEMKQGTWKRIHPRTGLGLLFWGNCQRSFNANMVPSIADIWFQTCWLKILLLLPNVWVFKCAQGGWILQEILAVKVQLWSRIFHWPDINFDRLDRFSRNKKKHVLDLKCSFWRLPFNAWDLRTVWRKGHHH